MRPKGKLFALLAVFAAIGLVTASGAFTTVTAERTATANVAGDAGALIALEPTSNQDGSDYAQNTSDTLELNLNGYSNTASGINLNATTKIEAVFTITNNGGQSANISIEDSGANDGLVTFYNSSTENSYEVDEGGSAKTVGSGDSITVSVEINTTNAGLSSNDELINGFTINATST